MTPGLTSCGGGWVVLQGKTGLGPTGRLGTGRAGYHGGIFWVHTPLALGGEAGCVPYGWTGERGPGSHRRQMAGCTRPGCQPSALPGRLSLAGPQPPGTAPFTLGWTE